MIWRVCNDDNAADKLIASSCIFRVQELFLYRNELESNGFLAKLARAWVEALMSGRYRARRWQICRWQMCVVGGEGGTFADNYVAVSCVCAFGVRLFGKPLK